MIDVHNSLIELEQQLLALLRSLTPTQWQLPTVAPQWTVKDVVAHLLDGALRRISLHRDGYSLPPTVPITSYDDLVRYLNELNREWVLAHRRTSPQLLIEMMTSASPQMVAVLTQLPPHAPAIYGVAWAGQQQSENWFDVAREYTERYTHQQQIRVAIGDEDTLLAPAYYLPYLRTSLHALPHRYRNHDAPVGSTLQLQIAPLAQHWLLTRHSTGWQLTEQCIDNPTTHITLPARTAWRMFSKAIDADTAAAQATVLGDAALAQPFFGTLAIMA